MKFTHLDRPMLLQIVIQVIIPIFSFGLFLYFSYRSMIQLKLSQPAIELSVFHIGYIIAKNPNECN